MSRTVANLNYFFALLLVGSALAALTVVPPIEKSILSSGGTSIPGYMASSISALVVAAAIAMAWKLMGELSPLPGNPSAAFWFRIGNKAIIIANSILGLSVLVCAVGYFINPDFGLLIGFIIAIALLLGVPLNALGIFCVETSRMLNRSDSSSRN